MAHEWMIEVLQDMRSYSQKNGLPALTAQLEETLRVATDEIAAHGIVAPPADPDDTDD